MRACTFSGITKLPSFRKPLAVVMVLALSPMRNVPPLRTAKVLLANVFSVVKSAPATTLTDPDPPMPNPVRGFLTAPVMRLLAPWMLRSTS